MRLILKLLALLCLLGAVVPGCQVAQSSDESHEEFSLLAWNIWRGGREDGEQVGPQRVVEVIQASGADVIAMQETYGSGEWIAEQLGYHFVPRGTNVSIFSRFPVVADVSVFQEFKCVGAIVELPNSQLVAVYSIWLPYDAEIWAEGTREGKPREELLAATASSASDLQQIRELAEQAVIDAGYGEIPIVFAGDFNSMSHLDYTAAAGEQYGYVIDWPTSRVMTDHGYVDAYRTLIPEVDRQQDRTWTPRFPEQQQDRIDFVYWRGALRPIATQVIDEHAVQFPSDHAALLVSFAGVTR